MLKINLFWSAYLNCFVVSTTANPTLYSMVDFVGATSTAKVVPLVPERVPTDLTRRSPESLYGFPEVREALRAHYAQEFRIVISSQFTDASPAMSLRVLRDRLTAIIDENERSAGRASRNDLPVYLRVKRGRNDFYIPVELADACQVTISGSETGLDELHCITLQGRESEMIRTGKRDK